MYLFDYARRSEVVLLHSHGNKGRPNLKLFRPVQNKTSTGQLMCDVLWNQKSVDVCKIQINMIPGGETINHILRV